MIHQPNQPNIFREHELPPAPARGKLGAVLFPPFLPKTNLLPVEPDAQGNLPTETWTTKRPLINMGGHRVALKNESLDFSFTQTVLADDAPISGPAMWDFGDGVVQFGKTVSHAFAKAGLYLVSCTYQQTTSQRYVRVLKSWGESDLNVISLDDLSAAKDSGWSAALTIAGSPAIKDLQGVLLYVYDEGTDWHERYDQKLRDLSRRTAFSGSPGAKPEIITKTTFSTVQQFRSICNGGSAGPQHATGVGSPSGDCWTNVNRFDALFAAEGARSGVPPNLLKALANLESCGDPNNYTPTGNGACPYAIGLMQIACGCAAVDCGGYNFDDPASQIRAGADQISANFRQCGSWESAVVAYFAGHCTPNGAADILGTDDYTYVQRVMQLWAEADAAIGGAAPPEPRAEVIFAGYVADAVATRTANQQTRQLRLINAAAVLDLVSQRMEAFWEEKAQSDHGGCFIGAPMRHAHCLHHTLTEHSNFPTRHDCLIDYSGPRFSKTTAAEGSTYAVLQSWAQNDFAHCWGDRQGRLRYEPDPHYRGHAWFKEASLYAAWVPRSLIVDVQIDERELAEETIWTKLCGVSQWDSCEICGTFPCEDPKPGPGGKWANVRGLTYDDYQTLCKFAAYHHAYLNRALDLRVTMLWRHDLELNDLLAFPNLDPMERAPLHKKIFVVASISHQYDTAGTWLTTVGLEELTYGAPCDCKKPSCIEAVTEPAPTPVCMTPATPLDNGRGPGACVTPVDEMAWKRYDAVAQSGIRHQNVPVRIERTGNYHFQHPPLDSDNDPFFFNIDSVGPAGLNPFFEETFDGSPSTIYAFLDTGLTKQRFGSTPAGETEIGSYTDDSVYAGWIEFVVTGAGAQQSITFTATPTFGDGAEGHLIAFPISDTGLSDGAFTAHPLDRDGSVVLIPSITASSGPQSVTHAFAGAAEGQRWGVGLEMVATNAGAPFNPDLGFSYRAIEQVDQTLFNRALVDSGVIEWTDTRTFFESIVSATLPENHSESVDSPGSQTYHWENVYTEEIVDVFRTFGVSYASAELEVELAIVLGDCAGGGNAVTSLCCGQSGDGGYGGGHARGGALSGTCPNWPTAEAIDGLIQNAEAANGRPSPLSGMGQAMLTLGQSSHVNPGVVAAILEKESQCGADGSVLPATANNFAGITGVGSCGSVQAGSHSFAKYCSVEQGLAAVFTLLAGAPYSGTDGTLGAVIELYSPSFENNVADMWSIIQASADIMGITLERATSIYTDACSGMPDTAGGSGFGGYSTALEYALHQAGAYITQGPFEPYSHANCDCYDIAVPSGTPLYPLLAGVVTLVGFDSTYGNHLDIQSAYGSTRFGHLQSIVVNVGDAVSLSTLVGYSNNTGNSSGPHLHLQANGGGLTAQLQGAGFNIANFPWSG